MAYPHQGVLSVHTRAQPFGDYFFPYLVGERVWNEAKLLRAELLEALEAVASDWSV